jgi:hypothetical protein
VANANLTVESINLTTLYGDVVRRIEQSMGIASLLSDALEDTHRSLAAWSIEDQLSQAMESLAKYDAERRRLDSTRGQS